MIFLLDNWADTYMTLKNKESSECHMGKIQRGEKRKDISDLYPDCLVASHMPSPSNNKSWRWWAHGQSYKWGGCPVSDWWDTDQYWTFIHMHRRRKQCSCSITDISSLLWPLWEPVHPALRWPPPPSSSAGPSSCVCAAWTDPASACAPGQTWYQRHRGKCSSSSWPETVKNRGINNMSVG